MKWLDLLWQLGQGAVWNVVRQLEQWRWQLMRSLFLVLLAAACGGVVLLLVAGLVLLQFWDTHRHEALWLLLLGYALMGGWLMQRAGRSVGRPMRQNRCGVCSDCRDARARADGGCRAGP
jgi:uncharacterized membrane protein YqjE